jgi:hypothetical protein
MEWPEWYASLTDDVQSDQLLEGNKQGKGQTDDYTSAISNPDEREERASEENGLASDQ